MDVLYSCTICRDFNPRTSCEVRLLPIVFHPGFQRYFNPRTSCEVRPNRSGVFFNLKNISIHAPRVRCDLKPGEADGLAQWISIHAPRVRCDFFVLFCGKVPCNISIHAPRVRCDHNMYGDNDLMFNISIHAPRVRCDDSFFLHINLSYYFNPRTSCEVRP